MNTDPIISIDGIFLREFNAEDLHKTSLIYGNEDVMKYIGLGGAKNEAETGNMISSFMRSYEKNGFGIWACIDRDTSEIIGHCGFNILPGGEETEIAYLLDKPWWGKGIATSIAKETLRYGFDTLGMTKVVALAYRENKASVRVIEKIGMKAEGEREFFGKSFLYFTKVKDSS